MKKTIALGASIMLSLVWSGAAMAQDVFDSDGDGYDDNSDNCTLVANAAQRDTDGDHMGNMCDPDLNNDGVVNPTDLGLLRSKFFSSDPDGDFNGDGDVNTVDLGRMIQMYFGAPGPTGTDPNQPPCNCYFSGDCNDGDPGTNLFCDWGPDSYATEDICVWRDIKPNGQYGAGCSIESDLTTGAWTPNICDGVCVESFQGSAIGYENTRRIAQTIAYWGEAMIKPSAEGGGPVDPAVAAQATSMQFNAVNVSMMLGRQTADALAMAAGEPFHNYFCHWEGHPDDDNPPVVNLAGDTCRITSGELTVQALVSEIQNPGSAAAIMRGIAGVCADWKNMFGTQCEAGPGALDCAIDFIEAQAHFLRTPSVASGPPDVLNRLFEKASR